MKDRLLYLGSDEQSSHTFSGEDTRYGSVGENNAYVIERKI